VAFSRLGGASPKNQASIIMGNCSSFSLKLEIPTASISEDSLQISVISVSGFAFAFQIIGLKLNGSHVVNFKPT